VVAWDKHAVPWQEALKRELLKVGPVDSLALLERLGTPLTTLELEQVRALSTDSEWRQIRTVLQNENFTRSFMYGGETFVERPGLGWYRVNPHKPGTPHETHVAEAFLVPQSCAMVDGDVHYTGEVVFREHRFGFSASEAELRKDPAAYITKICVQREVGVPTFMLNYRKHLLDMSLCGRKVPVAKSLDRVGHDAATGRLVFPKFTVDRGTVSAVDPGVLPARTPAAQILPYDRFPRPSLLQRLLAAGYESSWAGFVAVLANVVAPLHGRQTYGIAPLDTGGVGERLATAVGTALGLQSVRIGKFEPSALELDQLANAEQRHGLPVVVRYAGPPPGRHWADWARNRGPRNCILPLGVESALSLSLQSPWALVTGGEEEFDLSGFEALVAPLLGHLTSPAFTPDPQHWLHGVVDGARAALFSDDNAEADTFFSRVKGRLVDLAAVPLWRRFLYTLHCDLDKERLIPVAGGLLEEDHQAFCWRLRWDKLMKDMNRRWLLPNGAALTDALHRGCGAEADKDHVVVLAQDWLVTRDGWRELAGVSDARGGVPSR